MDKDKLPTDISSIPEADRELFEEKGQETPKPDVKPEVETPKPEKVEEVKPKAEDTEKETHKTDTPKQPPKQFVGVPIHQANAWRKKAQELEKELTELKNKLATTEQKNEDADNLLKSWGEKYGLSDEQLTPYKELVENIISPFKTKLSALDEYEKKSKEEKERDEALKAYNQYFDEAFDQLKEDIQKEHTDISDGEVELMRQNLKLKIEKEGLYSTPINLVYKAFSDFRPEPKKKTIEPSGRTSAVKSIDKNSEKDLAEALSRGDIDLDEVDAIMTKKGGGRFTVQS